MDFSSEFLQEYIDIENGYGYKRDVDLFLGVHPKIAHVEELEDLESVSLDTRIENGVCIPLGREFACVESLHNFLESAKAHKILEKIVKTSVFKYSEKVDGIVRRFTSSAGEAALLELNKILDGIPLWDPERHDIIDLCAQHRVPVKYWRDLCKRLRVHMTAGTVCGRTREPISFDVCGDTVGTNGMSGEPGCFYRAGCYAGNGTPGYPISDYGVYNLAAALRDGEDMDAINEINTLSLRGELKRFLNEYEVFDVLVVVGGVSADRVKRERDVNIWWNYIKQHANA